MTGTSDLALQSVSLLGVLLSLMLLFGRWERLTLILLFILYLSLYHAGQIFTNFQWDTLLLEAGFLAIFLAGGGNLLLIFLFEWLLFRLRFSQSVQRFGIGHNFHIFPTMQTQRQELIIQGSDDGKSWQTYEFKYKPGNPAHPPEMIIPHQPRLDWMIWFVPTQQPLQMEWFGRFMQRLHQGSESVTALLRHNPFPDRPPQYLRVQSYAYHFSTPKERDQNGNWWRGVFLGYFPQVAPRVP